MLTKKLREIMNKIFEKLNPNNPEHETYLTEVSGWSAECQTMKFYDPDDLKRQPLAVVAKCDEGEMLGYVGLTEIDNAEKRSARIGALAINPDNYGQGIATDLIDCITNQAGSEIPGLAYFYAYVHKGSLKPFEINGFSAAGIRNPISETGCNIIVNRPA